MVIKVNTRKVKKSQPSPSELSKQVVDVSHFEESHFGLEGSVNKGFELTESWKANGTWTEGFLRETM
jgi:hypothetical protein